MAEKEQKTKRRHTRHSWFIKRQIVVEYLEGSKTLQELSAMYDVPNQTISNWLRSYTSDLKKRKAYFGAMTPEEQKSFDAVKAENECLKKTLEIVQNGALLKENERLKKDLEFARMKTLAMETIIDLARNEYGIELRKNSGAKQPVKLNTTARRQK